MKKQERKQEEFEYFDIVPAPEVPTVDELDQYMHTLSDESLELIALIGERDFLVMLRNFSGLYFPFSGTGKQKDKVKAFLEQVISERSVNALIHAFGPVHGFHIPQCKSLKVAYRNDCIRRDFFENRDDLCFRDLVNVLCLRYKVGWREVIRHAKKKDMRK